MITLNSTQLQTALNTEALKKEGINGILKMTLNAIMYSEREIFLEQKGDPENKGNGYRPIKVTSYGRQLALAIPRDRLGVFEPLLTAVMKEEDQEIQNICYELYREGLTTRRISKIIERIYKKRYSKTTISSMSNIFKGQLEQWRNRHLEKRYLAVYLDGIQAKVRRGTVQGEAFYIALAVKEDYTREVIAIRNNPTESASGWEEVLKNLKARGVEKIDLIIADRISGLEDKVLAHYPKAAFQKCVVHLMRNIIHRVRPKEKAAIAAELKVLFDISDNTLTKEKAYLLAEGIIDRWKKKYPNINRWLSRETLRTYFTCLDFNYKIRRMIYTTNWVERLNKEFRRALKIRISMPSVESVLLLLSAIACDMEQGTYSRPVHALSDEPRFQRKLTNMSNL